MQLTHTYLTVCAVSVAMALSVGIGAWGQRGRTPAAGPLAFVMSGLAVSAAFLGAQVGIPGQARLLGLVTLVAISVVVAGFYCETRALVDHDWRLRRRTVAWLAVHPFCVFVFGGLNPGHLFAEGSVVGGAPQLAAAPGPLFWVHVAYGYTMTAWCLQHLGRAMVGGASPLQRRQLRSVLLAAAIPLTATVASLVRARSPQGSPDLTPLSIALAGLVHYYAVFRQGLLRLLPVARDLVVEHVGDAIFVMDADDRLVDVNPASHRLAVRLGWDRPGDLLGVHAWALLPAGVDRREVTDGEHHLDLPAGPLDLDLRTSEVRDGHGRLLGRVIVVRDVTELNDQRRQLTEQLYLIDSLRRELAEQAVRDDLTGLHNRRHLLRQLEDGLEHARWAARPFSLIKFGLDHLSAVDTEHGREVADTLLIAVASALLAGIGPGQTLARSGGGEFVVLLPDTSMEEAADVAEGLRARCSTARAAGRRGSASATLSGGIATFPGCGWTGVELLRNAEAALYAAQHAGRDRVVCAPIV